MPIIWRYVTKTYLKIFALTLATLFGLSFLIKHKKLTLLIVAGATYKQAFLLALCMLSITLPHIIGICSFISSLLTAYKLNSSGEITSLRASGLSFSRIFTPIYFAGGFLMLVNIFLVFEVIPYSKLLVNKLYQESQTINPLVLLRKNALPILKNVYTEMNLSSTGSESNNVLIAYFLETEKKIALLLAENLNYANKTLEGKKVALISYFPSEPDLFDHLIIDNQAETSSPESFFISLLNRPSKVRDYDVFSLQALLESSRPSAKSELFQRISKIFYPFTFTILGLSAGLLSRKKLHKQNLTFLLLSTFGYFASFFALKNASIPLFLAIFYTLGPHLLITFFSFMRQKKIVEGEI